jgi:hypothetical protein
VLPASTLKTLTAVTLMPVLDKTQVVTASDKATHADGSHVGLVSGGTYTVWDLWHALLLPSANDAAYALAEANGGMVATIRAMQSTAIRLGALDTVVKSDSGLDHPGQVTSAYDMALFARAAMADPDFATVTKTVSYSFPGKVPVAGAKRATYKIYSQNRLLLHGFPGIVGGKTGFTSLAHRTFWAAASRGFRQPSAGHAGRNPGRRHVLLRRALPVVGRRVDALGQRRARHDLRVLRRPPQARAACRCSRPRPGRRRSLVVASTLGRTHPAARAHAVSPDAFGVRAARSRDHDRTSGDRADHASSRADRRNDGDA